MQLKRKIDIAFVTDTVNERKIEEWFQKFRTGDYLFPGKFQCGNSTMPRGRLPEKIYRL